MKSTGNFSAFTSLMVIAGLLASCKLTDELVCTPSSPPPDVLEEAPCQPRMSIESAFYRRVSEHDTGTLRVYIRNITNDTLVLREVLLDGLPISVWGIEAAEDAVKKGTADRENFDRRDSMYLQAAARVQHRRIIWAHLAPAHVPPDGIAELAVKLANPMSRPMRLELIPIDGGTISTVIRPIKPTIEISAVTFSHELDNAYIYIEGAADVPVEIESIVNSCYVYGYRKSPEVRKLQGFVNRCVVKSSVFFAWLPKMYGFLNMGDGRKSLVHKDLCKRWSFKHHTTPASIAIACIISLKVSPVNTFFRLLRRFRSESCSTPA